jgi:hypothetical protein
MTETQTTPTQTPAPPFRSLPANRRERLASQAVKAGQRHTAAVRLTGLLRDELRALEEREPELLQRLATTNPTDPSWKALLGEFATCTIGLDWGDEILRLAVEEERKLLPQVTA